MGEEPKLGNQFSGDGPAGVGEQECPECRGPEGVEQGGKGTRGSGLWSQTRNTPRVPRTCFLCLQITSLQQEGEELSGQARCPFDATQSNVAVLAGVHLGM